MSRFVGSRDPGDGIVIWILVVVVALALVGTVGWLLVGLALRGGAA